MKALRWHLHSFAAAVGLPGLVSALLLAVCAMAWIAVEEPAMQRVAELRSDNEQLVARARDAVQRPVAVESTQAALAHFDERFPDERRITAALARLRAVAARSGIALERGEFKVQAGSDDALAQYAMVLPVKAEYRALRRFVRELLREQPAIALDEVSVRRDDAKSPLVEAQLRLVLFVAPKRGD
jgi:Tfp pilus assembly protein PilO